VTSHGDADALPEATPLVERLGQVFFGFRNYLTPVGLAITLLISRPQPFLGSPRADSWLDLLGIAVAALGQCLRIAVIGFAYIRRGGIDKRIAAPVLVREGFYGHSRNPMYVGNFGLLLGLSLIYNAPIVYFVILPGFVFAIWTIIRAEERFLADKFGADYQDYCREVPRLLPRLRGLRETMASMQFDWKRVLRKEYTTTFNWMTAVLWIIGYERVSWNGFAASRPLLLGLACVQALLLVGWGVARWLKKTRRIK